MKTKKIIIGLFILIFSFIISVNKVDAASCKIGVSAPANVVVGNKFNVTVTVSGGAPIGSWDYTLSYDSSLVRLNSGQLHVVDYGNGSKKSASYSYSFTSLKSGTATFKIVNASVLDYASTNECLSSRGTASVKMKTQAEIEESYSRNNNLKSLTVEGGELTPVFSKDITEYNVTLPVDTTKAIISGAVEDGTASVIGLGEVDVVDGLNKFEVVVTAQHGEKKTYILNITVQELDPINVKVNKKDYTVVRKKGQIENIPVGFNETTVKINDQDIAAYKSEATNLVLVVLKDNAGTNNLFIYDEKNNSYKEFSAAKGNMTNLLILENNISAPKGFEKTTFNYNNEAVEGYKLKPNLSLNKLSASAKIKEEKTNDDYYLVYAQNLETGSKGFYLYDKKDNTFQLYFEDLIDFNNNDIKLREYIIIGLLGIILFIMFIKMISSLTSKEKKIKRYEKKIAKLKGKIKSIDEEDSYDVTSINIDDEPIIKKVEEDEYDIPKRSKKEKLREIKEAKERLDSSVPAYKRFLEEDDE